MKLGKKLLSIVLAAVLCLSMVPSAFADNSLGVTYQAKLSASELTQSTEAQEVVLEINANSVITYDSIGAEIKIPSGWELTAITNKEVTLLSSEYTLKAADGTGSIGFQSRSGDNETITNICVLTYKVPANAAPGVYQLGIEKLEIAKDYGTDIWEKSGAVTATLTIKGNTPAHEHVWSDAWSKDATHHWHDCTATGCDVTVNADKNGYAAHNYNKKVTTKDYLKTAANCTDAAVYYYSCECGAIGTKTFTDGTALGHTPSTVWSKDATHHWHVCTVCNVEMDKAAHTPDHEGGATETYPIKCTECGYVIEAQLDHTHSFTQEVAEAKYLKSAAGCDAPAVYYKSCTCGEASTTETFQYGTALGHSYTAEKVADQYLKTAATCTEDAVYFKSCARCGDKGTETFTATGTALGHVQASPWAHNDTEHWQVCTRCNEAFNKAAHNGGTATCQNKATCEVCGAAYGKLGEHNFDTKWTSDGTHHYHKCLTAGCTEKKEGAEHSSTGDNIANCLHKAKCDVCAAEYGNLGAHTLTKTAAKAPTCLEPGNNEYYTCSVCGKVFKDAAGTTETTVAAETLAKSTTHVVESKYVTSATEHWQICKVCGTVVGKAAHKFGEADANGRKTCADCGYTVGGTGTEGHKHAAGNTICYDENNHWNKCTDNNCDAHVNESAHKFGPKNTVTEGNKTITIETCSECGYVKRTETTTGGTTPVNPGGNKPTKPGTKDNGKTVQSGKTFDAGVGVYVGLSILSLTGSAVVIGKKRKTR